jgi:hypothetical protein
MTGPNVTTQTVRITGDVTDLNQRLAEGIRQLEAFGRSVNLQSEIAVKAFRDEAAALQQMTASGNASVQNLDRLTLATQRFENQVAATERRTAVGFEGMSRGMLMMARSSDIAGRGMASALAAASNVAFAFGPTGAIVGAVAIGGLALYEVFDRSAAKAKKLQESVDKVIESTDRLKITALSAQLQAELSELQQGRGPIPDTVEGLERLAYMTVGQDFTRAIRERLLRERDLRGAVARAGAAAGWLDQRDAGQDRLDVARKNMEDARSEALQRERELTKAVAEGNLRLVQLVGPQVDALVARAKDAEATVRNLIESPMGVGQMLHLNIGRELAHLHAGDVGFAGDLAKARDQGDFEIAQKAAEKGDKVMNAALKAAGDAVDKSLKDPKIAAALLLLGAPLQVDKGGFTDAQLANLDAMLGAVHRPRFDAEKFEEAFQRRQAALARTASLAPPPGFDPTSHESVSGSKGGIFGFLNQPDPMQHVKKDLAEVRKEFTLLQAAGENAYRGIANATATAMDSMIRVHKISEKAITAALGGPLVKYLQGLAETDFATAASEAARGDWKGAAQDTAAGLLAEAGSALVAGFMGTGGGGSGASSSGGGVGSGQKNAGAMLGRGQNQGGTWTLEVLVTQKSEDGRQLSQTRQKFQRLDDRNQSTRLAL